MRTRTALITALVAVTAAGATAPAIAAKPKPKPKPITGAYKASALPDPTSTSQVTNEQCVPTLPTGKHSHPFTIPAAGSLQVKLSNKLDWSLALRDAQGNTLTSADGSEPQTPEAVFYTFKKKTPIVIDACNFAGEPDVGVSFVFTYK